MSKMLKKYIENSELRVYNEYIRVRLSKDLSIKYDNGLYDNALNEMNKCYSMIHDLNIKYPDGKKPILYIYIVPDENYQGLLEFPDVFEDGTGGGRPVECFDDDGFNLAYGTTQNELEYSLDEWDISGIENMTHEFSHIVLGEFAYTNLFIDEGFAEVLPMYILSLEDEFIEYKEVLSSLGDNDIISPQQLIDSIRNNTFGDDEVVENKSCSFRLSYISSYLFVKGIIKTIELNNNKDKLSALNIFLNLLKNANLDNEYLIYYIADNLGLDKDKLLDTNELQAKELNCIKESFNR